MTVGNLKEVTTKQLEQSSNRRMQLKKKKNKNVNMPNFYRQKKIFSSSCLLVNVDFPSTSCFSSSLFSMFLDTFLSQHGIYRGVPQALSLSPLEEKQVKLLVGQSLKNKRNLSST